MRTLLVRRLRQRRGRGLACREIVELVTDYVEGTMPAETVRAFERHLRQLFQNGYRHVIVDLADV